MPREHHAHGRTALDLLDRSLWPAALTEGEREVVRSQIVQRDYEAGSYVCRKGTISDSWLGIVEGFVRIEEVSSQGRPVIFTCVAAGGWFGEGSLLKLESLRFSAVATRATRVAHLPRPTFIWLVEKNILFNRFLLNHLNERLGQFIASKEFDRLLGANARVARFIASLFDPNIYPNVGPVLRISQEELGWLSGMSRQRVNQALNTLAGAGLLNVEYGGITVLDIEGLRAFT